MLQNETQLNNDTEHECVFHVKNYSESSHVFYSWTYPAHKRGCQKKKQNKSRCKKKWFIRINKNGKVTTLKKITARGQAQFMKESKHPGSDGGGTMFDPLFPAPAPTSSGKPGPLIPSSPSPAFHIGHGKKRTRKQKLQSRRKTINLLHSRHLDGHPHKTRHHRNENKRQNIGASDPPFKIGG